MRAQRNFAHVPNNWTLGIKICGANEQQPTLAVLPGDRIQQTAVDVVRNQICEGLGVGERISADQHRERLREDEIGAVMSGPHRLELPVIGWAEKRERRNQRACADTRHNLKAWTLA